MRNKFFCVIAIFMIILSGLSYFRFYAEESENKVKREVEKLSIIEREYLGNFFQYLIRISGFGYVLFGDKPMGIEFVDYGIPSKSIEGIDYMDDNHIAFKHRFKEGWEIWKKYQYHFPSDNFVFFEYEHDFNSDYTVICLINKKFFLRVVSDHISDFQAILGGNISPETVLEDYINKGDSLKIINNHDGLFGTLLGYGRNNAWNFKEQIEMENRTMTFFDQESLDEERFIFLPGFLVFPDTQETLKLNRNYREQRKFIEKRYHDKEFLKTTIERYIDDDCGRAGSFH
jgi:hypothetical protein